MLKVKCSRRERSACPVATKEHIGDCTGSKVKGRTSGEFN